MPEYDDRGKVSIWPNRSDNPNAPILKGKLFAHRDIAMGEELEISLWENESDHPQAPKLKGSIKDKYVPKEKPVQQGFRETENPEPDDEFKDRIPF